jgi:hypothetical protein
MLIAGAIAQGASHPGDDMQKAKAKGKNKIGIKTSSQGYITKVAIWLT